MLYVCEICGETYISDEAAANCPYCGVKRNFQKPYREAKVKFNIELTEKDRGFVTKALDVEVSNAAFYTCAANSVKDFEGKYLFKNLAKVEHHHAKVWKKILKMENLPVGDDTCSVDYKEDLQESHDREDSAIKFYEQACKNADDSWIKTIFMAFVDVEQDHLKLSEERL